MVDPSPWEGFDPNSDADKLIAEVMKQERLNLAREELNHHLKQDRKVGRRRSGIDRIIEWFMHHPDEQITPSELGLELRIKSSSIRARMVELRQRKVIRQVWDPVHARYHRGLYELNRSEMVIHPGTAPLKLHGIKFEIERPRRQIETKKGKVINAGLLPEDLKEYIISYNPSQFIRFQEVESEKNHVWAFHGVWKNRDITLAIHKGKASLVEIFCKATHDPLTVQEFIEYHQTLNLFFSDIWTHSEVWVTQLGLNHDIMKAKLDGIKRIKVQALNDYFVQVYQKGPNVRYEAHTWKKIPDIAVLQALQSNVVEMSRFYDRTDLSIQNIKITEQKKEITILKDKLETVKSVIDEMNGTIKEQGSSLIDIVSGMGDMAQILKGAVNTGKDRHPTYISDDSGLDRTGYG